MCVLIIGFSLFVSETYRFFGVNVRPVVVIFVVSSSAVNCL